MEPPEFYPPKRVEPWLCLPPGLVVKRDLPDYEPPARDLGRVPQVRSEVARRFRSKFGNQAALDWLLEPERMWLLNKTLQEVWLDDVMHRQFFDDSKFIR